MYAPLVAVKSVNTSGEITIARTISIDLTILELLVVVQLVDVAVVAQVSRARFPAVFGRFSTAVVVRVQIEERRVILAEYTRSPT